MIVVLSSCTSQDQEVLEHPEYFDAVFLKADSIGMHDVPAAMAYLDTAYAAFREPGAIDLFRKYQYNHLYYLHKGKDISLAMLYADSMLYTTRSKAVQERYPLQYGLALLSKGDVLRDQKKYNDAYPYFYLGRKAIQQTGDTCRYHEYASKLALVYYWQEKYDTAARYFIETFERLSYCDTNSFSTFYIRQGMLDNIALSYEKAGKTDRALAFYDSTLRFIRKYGGEFSHVPEYKRGIDAAIGVVYGNKGNVLLKLGDTLGAEILYRQSIDINMRGKDEKVDAQLTMAKLAGLYLAGNRLANAGQVLQEMKAALAQVPGAEIEARWRHLQWQYLDRTGQRRLAYTMLKAYVQLNDSLNDAASRPAIADINQEFDRISGEYQLEVLKKNDELKTAYLIILVFLSVSVILIAWMIWQHWRRSRRHVEDLRQLNQQILAQHDNIQKSLASLEQSQRDNSRIMKIVAHDLRSPVGAISGLAELLLDTGQLGEKDVELLQLIRTASSRANSLISDLLVLDTSMQGLEKEIVEIHVALKYCVDLLQLKATEKKQEIILSIEPVKVLAYREKIWRVFSNLINNAIKFSPDGSRIVIVLERSNGNARVSVKDEGIGIPPGIRDKIFSLSSEVKRRGTRGEESFGLGLSISRQIIEAHEGKIWFETEEGRGTTFYVEMKASA
ncbi:tetratricopeptide repeat-containing sensor histidine kinase [Chitinophaga sp. XS-30]|uniref:sensor histidine kinase n=1 Tax=Chitinophaga sp. XS-30 TaxID=2604421 RepID=UPI00143DF801|nr:tetratricopeptide repeat-containing sensor histidine kinase [Chitinophaga sp. XS-30]